MKCFLVLFLAPALSIEAQTYTPLASFPAFSGGLINPLNIIQASDGNFYGVTYNGGVTNAAAGILGGGTAFQLTPNGILTTLYQFGSRANDGVNPNGIIQGADGNFYGTTAMGGTSGAGTVFKLTTQGTMTTLASFDGADGGSNPGAGIIQASDGNFYGTTVLGGTAGAGTIFQVTPDGFFTTLYSFGSSTSDGLYPLGALVQGPDGVFYGTTYAGGMGDCPGVIFKNTNCGTIFSAGPKGAFSTLYAFGQTAGDGTNPGSALILAKDGNFYGTTNYGGANGAGTFFEMTSAGVVSILYSFGASATDGVHPGWGVVQGADGNFYGVTSQGGSSSLCLAGCGSFFQITPAGVETQLHLFGSSQTDGTQPGSTPIQGTNGSFYGTAAGGGASKDGMVYQLTLAAPGPAIAASGGVLNGASFQPRISPGSWITISGTNFASMPDTWDNSIINGALPTTLDGVSVSVGGQPAYIEYISPSQINAIAPNVLAGSVPVTVTNSNGTSQAVNAQLSVETPAFFQWGTYAVATRQDYSYAVKNGAIAGLATTPAKPGDVIILWGTGFGPTSPAAPAGMETPSTAAYNTVNAVSVTVGGQPATVYGAALASGYAGLYQVAIQIPAGLANGDYPVIVNIDGATSPSTTLITVQQ